MRTLRLILPRGRPARRQSVAIFNQRCRRGGRSDRVAGRLNDVEGMSVLANTPTLLPQRLPDSSECFALPAGLDVVSVDWCVVQPRCYACLVRGGPFTHIPIKSSSILAEIDGVRQDVHTFA